MISLSISMGTATPVSVTDTGTSGYVLAAYSPGGVDADNALAQSRWLDGAALTSTRTNLTTIAASIQVWGTAYAHVMTQVDALGSALSQYSYTVTESYTGGSAVYTCLPASYEVVYSPDTLRANMAVVNATIPRQP